MVLSIKFAMFRYLSFHSYNAVNKVWFCLYELYHRCTFLQYTNVFNEFLMSWLLKTIIYCKTVEYRYVKTTATNKNQYRRLLTTDVFAVFLAFLLTAIAPTTGVSVYIYLLGRSLCKLHKKFQKNSKPL